MEMQKDKDKEEEEEEKETEEEEVFHISHIHFLIFKGIISHGWCGACNEPISNTPTYQCNRVCDGSFYRCLECNYSIHLECLPIPTTVKHKYHSHPLTLIDSFVEDDSGDYYCDACENERNPRHHVYYCEKCTYVIHIECLLSEERKGLEASTSQLPSDSIVEGKEIEDEPRIAAPDSDRTKGKEIESGEWSIAKIDEAIANYCMEITELVEKLRPLAAKVEVLQKLRASMLNPE
ncbi:uncharacterized protein LOC120009764 [Tripterygium wilfordii]|uniref:uncharacterized protein LOC120009764 n=1 Tax=Tripterygium wilfordii TaxID=458696 RepID=UPI0018F82152|nr:uncharacterized protein LOC120009764 [Tripterygium wilfordii]